MIYLCSLSFRSPSWNLTFTQPPVFPIFSGYYVIPFVRNVVILYFMFTCMCELPQRPCFGLICWSYDQEKQNFQSNSLLYGFDIGHKTYVYGHWDRHGNKVQPGWQYIKCKGKQITPLYLEASLLMVVIDNSTAFLTKTSEKTFIFQGNTYTKIWI